VSIKGEKVAQYADLYHALVDTDPGDIVEVVVIRDGVEKIIKVELTDRPSQMEWMVR
jgi:S1-C subfamily serine protease